MERETVSDMQRHIEVTQMQRCNPKLYPYCVSLVHSLVGYCIVVMAEDEYQVRQYCFKYLGKMWCSIYTEPKNMVVIGHVVHWEDD